MNVSFNGNTAARITERSVEIDGIQYVDFESISFEKREYIFQHADYNDSLLIQRKRPQGCGNEFLIKKNTFDKLIERYVSIGHTKLG